MKTVLMTCGKSLLKKGALATTDTGWGGGGERQARCERRGGNEE